MKRLAVVTALAAVCSMLLGCQAPEVSQGTVVRYDADSHLLVISDEQAPGHELALDTTTAALGTPPAVGDQVRVTYHEDGGRLVAERVMNVSRQEERRSGGH